MKMSFLKIALVGATALAMTACGGGGSDGGGNPPVNKAPVANAGSDTHAFGAKKVTLDASASYDDGSIVEYIWKEGDAVLGKGAQLSYLFVDGEHTITLTVKDDAGITDTDSMIVTAECMMATKVSVTTDAENSLNDAEGTLNFNGAGSELCYAIDLSSNKGTEKYSFYINLLRDTALNNWEGVGIKILDDSNNLVYAFDRTGMRDEGANLKDQFEIAQDGLYYVRVGRNKSATKYKFSIHPSIDNGLIHNIEGEINDFMNISTPLTLKSNNTLNDVTGDLNLKRNKDDSLKNTDNVDFFSINIKEGSYEFNMTLLNGTAPSNKYPVTIDILNENGEVWKFSRTGMRREGDKLNEQFTIPQGTGGVHYIRIVRNFKTRYIFNIQ